MMLVGTGELCAWLSGRAGGQSFTPLWLSIDRRSPFSSVNSVGIPEYERSTPRAVLAHFRLSIPFDAAVEALTSSNQSCSCRRMFICKASIGQKVRQVSLWRSFWLIAQTALHVIDTDD